MAEFLVLAVVAIIAAVVGASIKDRHYEQRLAPLRRAWRSRPYREIDQDRFEAMGSPWMVLPPAPDGGYKMFVDPFSSDLIVDVTSASLWQEHKDWNIGIAKGGRYDEVDTKLDRAHWEWVQDVWSTAGALLGEDRGSTITYREPDRPDAGHEPDTPSDDPTDPTPSDSVPPSVKDGEHNVELLQAAAEVLSDMPRLFSPAGEERLADWLATQDGDTALISFDELVELGSAVPGSAWGDRLRLRRDALGFGIVPPSWQLAGFRIARIDYQERWVLFQRDEGDEGAAGVGEPRRPLPKGPSDVIRSDIPDEDAQST